jgi:two-component system, OmpR family, sensor histidine kinase VicK
MNRSILGTYAERATPTQIIHGEQNVVNTLMQIISNTKHKIDACVDYTRPYLAIHINQLREVFLNAKKRGIKVRYLTEINKENLCYCKQLLTMVDELRHLAGIKGNFYVTDEEYGAPATYHEKGRSAELMIYSHLREVVEHQQYIFESVWNTSISADRKIKEIENEDNIVLGVTQVIDSPLRTQELFLDLIKSAKYEILLIMPTVNAFIREHSIGAIQVLKELAYGYITEPKKASSAPAKRNLQESTTRKERMSIRIITPINDAINKIINDMYLIAPSNLPMQRTNEEPEGPTTLPSVHPDYADKSNTPIIQLRHLESLPKYNVTTATILVVDRKASLVFEKIDDAKESFVEAVGLSTFSTSEPTIMSYVSIFENFWNQVDLYGKLKEHDRLQREFINIASHELRTPTQAILGYSTLVRRHPEMREEMLSYIERNAVRLQSLINNILDVSRIESRTLKLNKEKFNINEKIRHVIDDIQSKEEQDDEIKIIFNEQEENPIFVKADKLKIYEVLSNLLVNAVKFTKKKRVVDASNTRSNGSNVGHNTDYNIIISSMVKPNQLYNKDNTGDVTGQGGRYEVVISIKDRGTGIDPDIQDKLFSKFVTKSDTGSGLGLYISKGIVEAHGGKIWAENNSSVNGATFTFKLPVS